MKTIAAFFILFLLNSVSGQAGQVYIIEKGKITAFGMNKPKVVADASRGLGVVTIIDKNYTYISIDGYMHRMPTASVVRESTHGYETNQETFLFSVHPNPSDGFFSIESNSDLSGCDLTVSSLFTGNKVYQTLLTENYSGQIGRSLQTGCYMVTIKNSTKSYTSLLIVQ